MKKLCLLFALSMPLLLSAAQGKNLASVTTNSVVSVTVSFKAKTAYIAGVPPFEYKVGIPDVPINFGTLNCGLPSEDGQSCLGNFNDIQTCTITTNSSSTAEGSCVLDPTLTVTHTYAQPSTSGGATWSPEYKTQPYSAGTIHNFSTFIRN
jgi:hypothetical protein